MPRQDLIREGTWPCKPATAYARIPAFGAEGQRSGRDLSWSSSSPGQKRFGRRASDGLGGQRLSRKTASRLKNFDAI